MGKQDRSKDEELRPQIQRNSGYDSVLRRNEARSNLIKKMNKDEDEVMREEYQ